jgi:hypothetical protein
LARPGLQAARANGERQISPPGITHKLAAALFVVRRDPPVTVVALIFGPFSPAADVRFPTLSIVATNQHPADFRWFRALLEGVEHPQQYWKAGVGAQAHPRRRQSLYPRLQRCMNECELGSDLSRKVDYGGGLVGAQRRQLFGRSKIEWYIVTGPNKPWIRGRFAWIEKVR